MGYGLGDFMADIATGGAYSATKATAEASANILEDLADRDNRRNSTSSSEEIAKNISQTCCPKYQIEGDFLLDTNLGRVWRYDPDQDVYIEIQRKVSSAFYLLLERNLQLAELEAAKNMDTLAGTIPVPVPDVEREVLLESTLGFLRKELEKLKPDS